MEVAQAEARLRDLDTERASLLKIINKYPIPHFNAEWVQTAVEYAKRFAAQLPHDQTFSSTDIRVWSQDHGCPLPKSQRAWGPVMSQLQKLGVITRVGVTRTDYADVYGTGNSHHGQLKILWRVK